MNHIPKILFSALLLLSALYCTKQVEDNNHNAVTQKLTERDGRESSPLPVLNTDENGDYASFLHAPKFPIYDGQCRVILKLNSSFPGVTSAQIEIKGYDAPSLSSTLLFTIPATTLLDDDWTVVNIPQGAHLTFRMISGNSGDIIRVQSQEYGYNKATSVVGGPPGGWFTQNAEEFIIIPKFAPYSSSNRYICDSWCTWRINYSSSGEISNPNQPWIRLRSTWSTGFSVLTETVKNYALSGSANNLTVFAYPLSDDVSVFYDFVASSLPSNNPAPNFCYSLTPILPNGPLNINDVISNITYGTTPPIKSTSDCHLSPRSSNFPHCQ